MAFGDGGLFQSNDLTPEQEEAAKRQAYIDGLLVEREGYARRDLKEKVAGVDAELKRVGFTRADARAGRERATKKAPEQS